MTAWIACAACVFIAAAFVVYPIWFWRPANNEDWGTPISDFFMAAIFGFIALIIAAVKLIF